jgi:hypothetical protein
MIDSNGNILVIGRYYDLENHKSVQYKGMTDTGSNYKFEWTNLQRTKVVLIRTSAILEQFYPVLLDNDYPYKEFP